MPITVIRDTETSEYNKAGIKIASKSTMKLSTERNVLLKHLRTNAEKIMGYDKKTSHFYIMNELAKAKNFALRSPSLEYRSFVTLTKVDKNSDQNEPSITLKSAAVTTSVPISSTLFYEHLIKPKFERAEPLTFNP